MRAFLSHSSRDKELVLAIFKALEKDAAWLDRAEIEWGDVFLERIAEGIASATDFVLFWSAPAASSAWVRLEINMAFIQLLRDKAIRLRVVALDETPVPLYLKPFHALSVVGSADPAKTVLEKLAPLLREPVRSARARFVNRHKDVARIEQAVDDPEHCAIWLFGFTGVGKTSLVRESIRRIFEGADFVSVVASAGMGFVELALALNAERGETLAESLPQAALEREIRLSMETFAKDGRLLVFSNVQHWMDEDAQPQGPLILILEVIRELPAYIRRPAFLTSTRHPHLDPVRWRGIAHISIGGLDDEHIAALVRNWHYSIYGKELPPGDSERIAPKIFGHPIAAQLVAALLGTHSVEYLDQYPRELVSLRRDLARALLQDLKLGPHGERLMETLSLAGIALPASTIAACGFSDDQFQEAVKECTSAGLVTANVKIASHQLFQEFFWHRLHRSDYQVRATNLAEAIKTHLASTQIGTPEYAELLPVAFRLYALSGNLDAASTLRRDLSGEIEATAIALYNRRNYLLADKYIQHILDGDAKNWRMRLYRVRIRVRQEEWPEADKILSEMLKERQGDVGALHAQGWRYLRQNRLQEALDIFSRIISRREHIASLTNAAECLHRMKRNPEALKFLERAKKRESENPFILDLESRILEDMHQLESAFESALLASARDPLNGHLHHRLGQIRIKQGRPELSITHFRKAIEIDTDQFSPVNSLASALLDMGNTAGAELMLANLETKARTPADHTLVEHIKARVAFAKNDLSHSETILKKEISASHNLMPNLGLLVRVELAIFDKNVVEFPTIADVALNSAGQALSKLIDLEPSNPFIEPLRQDIEIRRKRGWR